MYVNRLDGLGADFNFLKDLLPTLISTGGSIYSSIAEADIAETMSEGRSEIERIRAQSTARTNKILLQIKEMDLKRQQIAQGGSGISQAGIGGMPSWLLPVMVVGIAVIYLKK